MDVPDLSSDANVFRAHDPFEHDRKCGDTPEPCHILPGQGSIDLCPLPCLCVGTVAFGATFASVKGVPSTHMLGIPPLIKARVPLWKVGKAKVSGKLKLLT